MTLALLRLRPTHRRGCCLSIQPDGVAQQPLGARRGAVHRRGCSEDGRLAVTGHHTLRHMRALPHVCRRRCAVLGGMLTLGCAPHTTRFVIEKALQQASWRPQLLPLPMLLFGNACIKRLVTPAAAKNIPYVFCHSCCCTWNCSCRSAQRAHQAPRLRGTCRCKHLPFFFPVLTLLLLLVLQCTTRASSACSI